MSAAAPGRTWRQRLARWGGEVRRNPTIVAISAEGFLTRLGFGMVGFALPLFALHLGMSLAEVGGLYALHGVTVLAVKPLMGWAADRFGSKRTLVLAVALRCMVGLLFVFASLPWHLYAIRVLQGVMTAARDPSASALIAVHGNRKSMASAFAWYYTARDVGHSLGAAAAGLLIAATGSYQAVFVLAFVSSCVALVSVVRYVREAYVPLLPYFGFGLLVAVTAEMMRGIFPIVAVHYGHLTVAEAGIAASASSIAILGAGPAFAWLSDNIHRGVGLTARSVANAGSSLLYIFAPGFAGFVAGRMLDDAGKAAFRPSWGATLAELADAHPERRARVMAFLDLAWNLGEIAGPLLAGVLMTAAGVPVMLALRAGLSVVAEGWAIALYRGKARG